MTIKKIIAWILRILSVLALFGVFGTAGACELGVIDSKQMIIQSVAFLAVGITLIALSERFDGGNTEK